jgi:hypothetical protein
MAGTTPLETRTPNLSTTPQALLHSTLTCASPLCSPPSKAPSVAPAQLSLLLPHSAICSSALALLQPLTSAVLSDSEADAFLPAVSAAPAFELVFRRLPHPVHFNSILAVRRRQGAFER